MKSKKINEIAHVVLLAIILKNVTLSPVMAPKKRLKKTIALTVTSNA